MRGGRARAHRPFFLPPLDRIGVGGAWALLGGILAFLSLPPAGWWPLGPVGAALLVHQLGRPGPAGRPGRRLAYGWLFGLGFLIPGLWWMGEFTAPGYPIAVVVISSVYAGAALVVPPGRGRWLAFPAALAGAEAARDMWPFGGVPLSELSLGQAAAPLGQLARLGGSVLVTAGVGVGAVALAALWSAGAGRRRPAEAPASNTRVATAPVATALVATALVAGATLAAYHAPDGGPATARITAAAVQGGGPRGMRAVNADPEVAFRRQVDATTSVRGGPSLILWPENVLELDGPLDGSPQDSEMRVLAAAHRATVVAGVTEPAGPGRFLNEVFAWTPDGRRLGPYVKVHRVPFGEWIPMRSFLRHFADLTAVPNDEVAGHHPGLVATPLGRFGVMISYEVFFDERSLAAVRAGAGVLLVPTNASSYTSGQVPAMEVAASRLRAIGAGRDLLQAAPTGYSAVIDHRGHLLGRSSLGRSAVVPAVLAVRRGATPFDESGPWAVRGLVLAGLAAGWAASRLPRGSDPEGLLTAAAVVDEHEPVEDQELADPQHAEGA